MEICEMKQIGLMCDVYKTRFSSSEVMMISPSKGSTQGGTTLTIYGRFFDQTDLPLRVLVGGISHTSYCTAL